MSSKETSLPRWLFPDLSGTAGGKPSAHSPTWRRARGAFVDRERLLDRLALSICRQLLNGRQQHYLIEHAGMRDAAEPVA